MATKSKATFLTEEIPELKTSESWESVLEVFLLLFCR